MSYSLNTSIQLILIILELFANRADTFNMTIDLQIVCSFKNGTNDVTAPPSECKSLAIPTKNLGRLLKWDISPGLRACFDLNEPVVAYNYIIIPIMIHNTHRLRKLLNTIKSLNTKLPLFLVDDTYTYYTWPDVIKKGASSYLGDIQQLGVNYIAFENTYKSRTLMYTERPNFSEDLAKFFDDANKQYPEVGFGLVIGSNIDWVKNSLNLGLLNKHVEFFLLDSSSYRYCLHENHQVDMNVLATKDDINGSLTALKNEGVDMSKLIYSIDLAVDSAKSDITFSNEEMTYTRLCSKKMSIHRKYCYSTIQNLFEKAKLHVSEKTLGIYVNAYNYDDFDGKCGCKTKDDPDSKFRGFKTIVGSIRDNKSDVAIYDCTEGHFPVILD